MTFITVSFSKHLNYADDICLVGSYLEKKTSRVELKINISKTKFLNLCINEQDIKDIELFEYLGSVVLVDEGTNLMSLHVLKMLVFQYQHKIKTAPRQCSLCASIWE